MVRVRTNVATQKRKKRILKRAKGSFGHRSKRFGQAVRTVIKGLRYHYRDRKVKKREFRALWIIRINAACKEAGISYSRFIKGLTDANVAINRKLLAEVAVNSPSTFTKLVKLAQENTKGKKETVSSK